MSYAISPVDLTDRVYVSQFDAPAFGLNIYQGSNLVDADDDLVTVVLLNDETKATVTTLNASKLGTGDYRIALGSTLTQDPGFYSLRWDYTVDNEPGIFQTYIEIGQRQPAYDDLDDDMKDLVDLVWLRFADIYDSPEGGPNAQVHLQTIFNRGRIGQLLRTALNRLNNVQPPQTTYVLSDNDKGVKFPMATWGSLLELATFFEAVKHLIRIYTEQPEVIGVNVARMDRRDYTQRWRQVLQDEQQDYQRSMELFKIRHMGLGRAHSIVSGGAYGSIAPTSVRHASAGRPRYWARYV